MWFFATHAYCVMVLVPIDSVFVQAKVYIVKREGIHDACRENCV